MSLCLTACVAQRVAHKKSERGKSEKRRFNPLMPQNRTWLLFNISHLFFLRTESTGILINHLLLLHTSSQLLHTARACILIIGEMN